MNDPKISVVIPLYNRKHFIKSCIDSALNQTFQDFEIVIRDDRSNDGAYELVEKNYSAEISSGKIRLLRNEKNLGESSNVKKLFEDAQGKYIMMLHNDDLYLPHALQHLYEIAENYQADVVHGSVTLISEKDGIIEEGSKLKKIFLDTHRVEKIEIMPENLNFRFREWLTGGTFQDAQYNIYSRKFLVENGIVAETNGGYNFLFSLMWIMKAKIFVKTPEIFYIRRDTPDSQINDKTFSLKKLEKNIFEPLELFGKTDKFISDFDFFRDNEEANYLIKAKIFAAYENLAVNALRFAGNKKHAPLYNLTENFFKKKFGSDGVYLALLYHWGHILQFNKNKAQNLLRDCLKIFGNDI